MLKLDPRPSADPHADARLEAGGGQSVELDGDADWHEAAGEIAGAVRVDIRFGKFNDGRGFTLASQLRTRLGFTGQLRAVGNLIPDQAPYLRRVGFDEVLPDRRDRDADWLKARSRFPLAYQPASDTRTPLYLRRLEAARAGGGETSAPPDLKTLNARYRDLKAMEILDDAINRTWRGRIAILSSFGAEAAVGLHMVAEIDPATPVIFLDTGRLFAQTEQYRRTLEDRLGLTNIRIIQPDADEVADEDHDDRLWRRDADACCALRKVRPLDRVLGDYDALITGRKRFHGGQRIALPVAEQLNGHVRVNPFADWDSERVHAYFNRFDLPRHPLTDMGYASIGCWTCTAPAHDDSDVRSGRWFGQDKTECGIHSPAEIAAE